MTWTKSPSAPKRKSGRRWQEIRRRWFARFPLCALCRAKGRVTVANQIDHIVPLSQGGADDESNYQSACRECNEAKRITDMGGKRRPRIGADGWPVDE